MRTIPGAMTWEMLARGRWALAAALLAAIAIPVWVLTQINHYGGVDPGEESLLIMHFVVVQMNIVIAGAAIYAAQGKISQLYAYPVRTSELVAWRMLPAMGMMFLVISISMLIANALTHVDWPVWGSALFGAVGLAAVQAASWSTWKSSWMVAALVLVASILGLWFKGRFGYVFSPPTHEWREITPPETVFLISAAVAAYVGGVFGVARNRRGTPPFTTGFSDWLGRIYEESIRDGMLFEGPSASQNWYEWRRKGWLMPGMVAALLVVGLAMWAVIDGKATALFEMFVAVGPTLWIVAFVGGILIGNVGHGDVSFAMGSFLASRPLTTKDMARAVLRTAVRSTLLTWLIWSLGFALVCGIVVAQGAWNRVERPVDLLYVYVPLVLIGTWVMLSVWMCICLTGRRTLFFQMFCFPLALYVGLVAFAQLALTDTAQMWLSRGVVGIAGSGMIGGTAWVYFKAWHQRLISMNTIYLAGVTWVGLSLQFVYLCPPSDFQNVNQCLTLFLLIGCLALAVAPWAAAPLALWWNRHR